MQEFLDRETAEEMTKKQEQEICRRVDSIYSKLERFYGAKDFVLRASKLDAIDLINSGNLDQRVLALQKIIQKDPTLKQTGEKELGALVKELEDNIIEKFARYAVEEQLEHRIQEKIDKKQVEYVEEIKKQVLKESLPTYENAGTLKKLGQLELMENTGLNRSALELLRPEKIEQVIGQEKAVKAVISRLNTPYPQHILLYGPPGVGKTSCARLALEMVRGKNNSAFKENAPFVEVDGSTLRWDPRESSNPLLGSVHDPIYQGASKDLAEYGIPEPKMGLVSEAHGGILFIDEIGEMDLYLQNKLLKVLEDKRVYFDSSYYDPQDERIPSYIKKMFEDGVPADFVLIGATTREREEISPAFRSRCMEIFFEPLGPREIKDIINNSAQKLGIDVEENICDIICDYSNDGRTANKILLDAYALALNEKEDSKQNIDLRKEYVYEALQNGRLSPYRQYGSLDGCETGKIFGLGVAAHQGVLIEMEGIAFPTENNGSIRFNDTAGTMARDSLFNAAAVFRKEHKQNLNDYDVHINLIGGGKVDGPSAGAAIYLLICSAVFNKAIRQDVAITGEISVQGRVKAVGGIYQKISGARRAGIKKVIIPFDNIQDIPAGYEGIEIVAVKDIREAYEHFFYTK